MALRLALSHGRQGCKFVSQPGCGLRLAPPTPSHLRCLYRAPNTCVVRRASSQADQPASGSKPIVTLLPGNGVGPEITNSVLEVFEAAGSPVEWEVQHEFVTTAPGSDDPVICEAAMDSLRRNRVGLKGTCGSAAHVPCLRIWQPW